MLPVVGATPATGRRLRACVGGAGMPAPTPGVPAAAAPRVPQAGEVFFSANGASSPEESMLPWLLYLFCV